jgi:flagellar FliL protein
MAMTEERIVSATTLSSAPAGGARAQDADGAEAKGKAKKPKLKKLLVLVLLVAVAGAAAWFFLFRGGPSTPKKPEKGAVVAIDPININLADGHYLKLGFALQLSKGAKADLDTSEALSIAIDQLTGQSMDRLSKTEERRKAVEALTAAIEKAYGEEEVIGLYPTTLVMQ